MIIVRIARGIHDHFPARMSEWGLAVMLLNLGLVLGQPNDTMQTSPSLSGLLRIAPEHVWAWALLLIGSVRLLALVVNGTFADTLYGRWSPHVRSVLSFLSCFFWMNITVGLTLSEMTGTGIAVYPVLLLMDGYNTVRAAGDAAVIDKAHKNART
jgi:hypothetical protein